MQTMNVTTASLSNSDPDGQTGDRPVASSEPISADELPPAKAHRAQIKIKVANPKLWDLKNPKLYTAVTTDRAKRQVVDTYETYFGIRTIKFDAEKGFFLNGQHVRLNGVCNHHDLGALGTAINTRALAAPDRNPQGNGLQRHPHQPQSARPRTARSVRPHGHGRDGRGLRLPGSAAKTETITNSCFADWHEKDLRALVRRDRNHPCVIIWSTGNEIGEQDMPDKAGRSPQELTRIVHEEDPTRPVTANCNNPQAGLQRFSEDRRRDRLQLQTALNTANSTRPIPTIPLVGSETASCISSRGEYFFPVSNNKDDGKADFQMSSYDLYAPPWATTPDTEFKGQDENPFVAGEFVWTGFDYLGEPTPYNGDTTNLLNFTDPDEKAKMAKELEELGKIKVPSRSSYFGILDLAGFKKDRFYIYQARWRPDLPMAHILPHWNWPERVGQVTPVHVYTSGDEAELFLNGKSLGKKKKEPVSNTACAGTT